MCAALRTAGWPRLGQGWAWLFAVSPVTSVCVCVRVWYPPRELGPLPDPPGHPPCPMQQPLLAPPSPVSWEASHLSVPAVCTAPTNTLTQPRRQVCGLQLALRRLPLLVPSVRSPLASASPGQGGLRLRTCRLRPLQPWPVARHRPRVSGSRGPPQSAAAFQQRQQQCARTQNCRAAPVH